MQTLEEIRAEKNQKWIITILDEFIEEVPEHKIYSARGSLAMYENPDLQSGKTLLGYEIKTFDKKLLTNSDI